MRDDELDAAYGRLAEAIGRVGEAAAPLLLATLVLDLMAGHGDGSVITAAIERAERLTRV